ncbi:hypothetical protein PaelaDRAFT_0001, partial [Paenibacillus lactis 154]
PAGGTRTAAGGCPAAGGAAGEGEAGRRRGRAPRKRAASAAPAAEGTGGRRAPARGNRAGSGRRLLHGSPPPGQEAGNPPMSLNANPKAPARPFLSGPGLFFRTRKPAWGWKGPKTAGVFGSLERPDVFLGSRFPGLISSGSFKIRFSRL